MEKPDFENDNDESLDTENVEGFHSDEIELEDIEEATSDKLKTLRQKLKDAETGKMEALEELQRTKADFLNSKRRLEEQAKRDSERGTVKIFASLMPLIDSFTIAMDSKDVAETTDLKLKAGLEAIHGQFIAFLGAHNIEATGAAGEDFNPEQHEAVANETVTDAKLDGKVTKVLQPGYMRNGEVLRPARVAVGQT